jgi:hypothetical protein
MAQTILKIKQGNALIITETIPGTFPLDDFQAKLYIKKVDRITEVDTITGDINPSTRKVVYTILNETSKEYVVGQHIFETKLWDTGDTVYTPSDGQFVVEAVLVKDPS